jgi:hypothetical protein
MGADIFGNYLPNCYSAFVLSVLHSTIDSKSLKHLEKTFSVCGGHLIPINFSPRNWEGKLCLPLKAGRESMPTEANHKP